MSKFGPAFRFFLSLIALGLYWVLILQFTYSFWEETFFYWTFGFPLCECVLKPFVHLVQLSVPFVCVSVWADTWRGTCVEVTGRPLELALFFTSSPGSWLSIGRWDSWLCYHTKLCATSLISNSSSYLGSKLYPLRHHQPVSCLCLNSLWEFLVFFLDTGQYLMGCYKLFCMFVSFHTWWTNVLILVYALSFAYFLYRS